MLLFAKETDTLFGVALLFARAALDDFDAGGFVPLRHEFAVVVEFVVHQGVERFHQLGAFGDDGAIAFGVGFGTFRSGFGTALRGFVSVQLGFEIVQEIFAHLEGFKMGAFFLAIFQELARGFGEFVLFALVGQVEGVFETFFVRGDDISRARDFVEGLAQLVVGFLLLRTGSARRFWRRLLRLGKFVYDGLQLVFDFDRLRFGAKLFRVLRDEIEAPLVALELAVVVKTHSYSLGIAKHFIRAATPLQVQAGN